MSWRGPTSTRLLDRRARQAVRREDWHAAAEAYQALVDRAPSRAEWHYRLGTVHQKARNWVAATSAYQAAIARDPTRPSWYYRLGQALHRSGHWTAAAHAFREADRRAADRTPQARLPTRRLSLQRRVDLSLVPKPAYAHGLLRSCRLAGKLGIRRISAVELGVAGGRGLVAMETHAREVESLTDVEIDVYGFDTGSGLRAPVDHRDLPYFFAAGNYAMDLPRLQDRLDRAELVLGDAAETFADFLRSEPEPIGLIAFDMDLYTPTRAVLHHLGDRADARRVLPRPTAYFDDVVGTRGQDYNDHTGELLAIREFNQANEKVKLAEDRRFRALPVNFAWHHGLHVLHRFDHPRYGEYVSPHGARTLRLR